MRILGRLAAGFLILVALLLVVTWWVFGGGERLPDRTTAPTLPASALEVVADLELPPGNIAVARTGRVFFTFHPEGSPTIKVAELVDGRPVPYPDEAFQKPEKGTPHFQTPLSLRIDRQDRLWVLDYASYGFGQPRLLAFDLSSNRLTTSFDFPPEVAGKLSMLNDFQVAPAGDQIYIAETSLFGRRPALVVFDVEEQSARRVLEGHPSVTAKDFLIDAAGRNMVFFGVFTLKIGVDSIALDRSGRWLYYGPVSDGNLYRVEASDLVDPDLSAEALASQVEVFAPKTLSDGLTTDNDGNVYLTDMEHSAIVRLSRDGKLTTLLKDERLRWPDGLSFGPGGWLYVTCSALHQVILRSHDEIRSHAPYQIFRFRPGVEGLPGH